MKERGWKADLIEIRQGYLWAGAKKTSQETAENCLKHSVVDEDTWKAVGFVEVLIHFDPWTELTLQQGCND